MGATTSACLDKYIGCVQSGIMMGDFVSLYPMSILLAFLGIENITPASEINDSNKD